MAGQRSRRAMRGTSHVQASKPSASLPPGGLMSVVGATVKKKAKRRSAKKTTKKKVGGYGY